MTTIYAMSSAEESARADLGLALCRYIGRDIEEPINVMEINSQTRFYDGYICILLAGTIGKPYERPVMDLAYGGFDPLLVTDYVNLVPSLSPHAQWTLNAYFKEQSAYRNWYHNLKTHNCDKVHRIIDTAIEHIEASGEETLPNTTDQWQILINFCRAHPHLRNTLLDRIPLSGEINKETLDLLVASPASSLADGTL